MSRRSTHHRNRAPRQAYEPPKEPKFLFQGLGHAIARAFGPAGPGSHRYTAAAQSIGKILEHRGLSLSGGRKPSDPKPTCVMYGYGLHPERREERCQALMAEGMDRAQAWEAAAPARDGLAELAAYSRRQMIRGVQQLLDAGLVAVQQPVNKPAGNTHGRWEDGRRAGGCLPDGIGNANEYVPGPLLLGRRPVPMQPAPSGADEPPAAVRESFADILARQRAEKAKRGGSAPSPDR